MGIDRDFDNLIDKRCPNCDQSDSNYFTSSGSCWDKEACGHRSKTYDNPEMQEFRDCFTTDNEQMYVALNKIMAITGHDHSNPIYEICIEAMPPRKS